MNRQCTFFIWILLLIIAMIATACTPQTEAAPMEEMDMSVNLGGETIDEHNMHDNHDDEDGHGHNMAHVHVEPPAEYAELTNPFADDHEALEAGEETYNTLCATCHGEEGNGDGPGAAALDPKPASLADGTMMNDLSDGYLFWRVSKGGTIEPFNSAMPPWETNLTEEQRWEVISYVRTLAEGEDSHEGDDHMDDDHMDDDHMDDDHMGDADDSHGEVEHVEDNHEEEAHADEEDEHMEDDHEETSDHDD